MNINVHEYHALMTKMDAKGKMEAVQSILTEVMNMPISVDIWDDVNGVNKSVGDIIEKIDGRTHDSVFGKGGKE